MEPIIYSLPKIDNSPNGPNGPNNFDLKYSFGPNPSPKLMKYGFNNLNLKFDLVELTANAHYKNGLNFNFDRTDSSSFVKQANEIFQAKNFDEIFDETFAELWEILNIFGFIKSSQSILTSKSDTVENIVQIYSKITNTKNNHKINSINSDNQSKPNKSAKTSTSNATLIIDKYSDTDVDENAYVSYLAKNISMLIDSQTSGSNMILQIFNIQTQIMVEMIYFISTFYAQSYLIKPQVSSDLSDSKYLVLVDFLPGTQPKLDFKHVPENLYLGSIGIQVPESLVNVIQCLNSHIIPTKYAKYQTIKTYLDSKIFEGATYQDLIQQQDKNISSWITNYTNLGNLPDFMTEILKKYSDKCVKYDQLIKILD